MLQRLGWYPMKVPGEKTSRYFLFSQPMLFHFNVYSGLLLVCFCNVLVYALMLAWRAYRQERLSDVLLAGFLFLAALYIVPWMTGFAGWYDADNGPYRNILFYTPFVHGLLMGPLLFFYLRSLTNFAFRLERKHLLHFLPGLLYLAWCIVVVVVDRLILKRYFLMNGEEDPDFQGWYQWLQRLSILAYLVVSIRYFRDYRRYTVNQLSFAEQAGFRWLRHFLIAFGILTALPLIKELLQLVPALAALNYVGSWYYFFAFALVVYYIAINGYHAQDVPLQKLHFEPHADSLRSETRPGPGLPNAPNGPADASIETPAERPSTPDTPAELQVWKDRLDALMQDKQPYTDPELTLSQLARACQTNPSQLSRVINSGYGMNFNDYINDYRVRALMDKLRNGEHHQQTLLGLAFDCGFNSKATFNRAFKKNAGISPKEWIARDASSSAA